MDTHATEAFAPSPVAATRTTAALSALMQMWEETSGEEEESESELMVMLSGMVGSHATSLNDE